MTKEEKLQKYKDWVFRMSAYHMAIEIISIDAHTVAPKGGSAYRDERTAYLAGELFSIETEKEMLDILKELKDDPSLEYADQRAMKLYYKQVMDTVCIPKEEFVAFTQLQAESYNIWLEAKQTKNYALYAPALKKIIETKKKFYGYRNSSMNTYDQMLDDFEPGMTQEKYDIFFEQIKERLVPLLHKIQQAEQIDDSFLFAEYPVEAQKKFMVELLEYLHFDPEWGYQNESEHPFTSFTCENDCRTTTKYLKDNVVSAILSTVHEVGHAYYEHNCDPAFDGNILSEGISCGLHESQSRLCENYLGRTLAFWKYNFPRLQKHFPQQLSGITLEQFVNAMNVAKASLVRTEADELTYPLHILVRYEIEKGLFNGTIGTDHLDEVWADMYEKYLGVRPQDASVGILQDVHWSSGDFGYFPTYALGSAFAAQFMDTMRKDIDVDDLLENNHYDTCIAWLKEHIHTYGFLYNGDELVEKVTGKPFDVEYYLQYLEEKYSKLYNL